MLILGFNTSRWYCYAVDIFRIGEHLKAYIELQEQPCFDIAILEDFPPDLLYKNSACAWIMAYLALKKRMGQKRRY